MRKVQSSVQLLEKQRNPGVGYWSGGNKPAVDAAVAAKPANGTDSGKTSGTQSPVSGEKGDEEEVNLEVRSAWPVIRYKTTADLYTLRAVPPQCNPAIFGEGGDEGKPVKSSARYEESWD
jgi:hypothetical protein